MRSNLHVSLSTALSAAPNLLSVPVRVPYVHTHTHTHHTHTHTHINTTHTPHTHTHTHRSTHPYNGSQKGMQQARDMYVYTEAYPKNMILHRFTLAT